MVIAIVGPTCVGKTKMSVELAKIFNGEVINADSTQVFKDLNIATAKITEEEKEGIVHHLFDIKNIDEDYTVFDYQRDTRALIDDIISRGKTPILCGGTGLYVKAACHIYKAFGYDFMNWFILSCYEDEYIDMLEDIFGEYYDRVLEIFSHLYYTNNDRKYISEYYELLNIIKCVKKSKKLV